MMDEFGISYLDLGLMFSLYSLPNLFMPFIAGVRTLPCPPFLQKTPTTTTRVSSSRIDVLLSLVFW